MKMKVVKSDAKLNIRIVPRALKRKMKIPLDTTKARVCFSLVKLKTEAITAKSARTMRARLKLMNLT